MTKEERNRKRIRIGKTVLFDDDNEFSKETIVSRIEKHDNHVVINGKVYKYNEFVITGDITKSQYNFTMNNKDIIDINEINN